MRVAGMIKIVTPGQRRVLGGQHRIFVTVKNAVAGFLRPVFAPEELRVLLLKLLQFFGKSGLGHGVWYVWKIEGHFNGRPAKTMSSKRVTTRGLPPVSVAG